MPGSLGYTPIGKVSATQPANGSVAPTTPVMVTPSGDGHETISPSIPQTLVYGAAQAFTVTANTGYTLSNSVGGNCPAESWSGNTYTTGAITSSCSLTFSATAAAPAVAVGQYDDSNPIQYPLIATSTNRGQTWTYTLDDTSSAVPGDINSNGAFNGENTHSQ